MVHPSLGLVVLKMSYDTHSAYGSSNIHFLDTKGYTECHKLRGSLAECDG